MSILSTSRRESVLAGLATPSSAAARLLLGAAASFALSLLGATIVLGGIWQAAAWWQSDLPSPIATMDTFWALVSNPLYDNGPNDKGVGLHVLASLQRVFTGFALAAAMAIPLGIVLGSSRWFRRIFDPVVQILRPVSPLAWFPIGMVVLQSTSDAGIFAIFICSLWPTVINTAFGVSTVPQSHKNMARVFQFSRARYVARVVLPHSLPHIVTGLRLSMGIAWLVIVAAEMLAGSMGIGFYVWESYNALNLERVLSAILLIGIVGLVLDRIFAALAALFTYPEVA